MSICTTYAGMSSPSRPEAPVRDPNVAGEQYGPGSKPHVCFVAPMTWPVLAGDASIKVVGGAEVQQSIIARALASRGYRVSMICHDYGQPDKAVVDGITVYKAHAPDEGLPVIRYVHPRMTRLWHALKRVNADVYYQRTSDVVTAVTALFCRRYGKKSIYAGASDMDFVPGSEEMQYARDKCVYRFGLRRMDQVIVQNKVQLDTLKRNFGRDAPLVRSCYAPPPGARADRQGYVLWAAVMRDTKRPELAFEIARRLPHLRFVMIGGNEIGRGREYFDKVAVLARDVPNVEFVGFVPYSHVDQYFNGARILLNTSLFEGFPNTFLQAWSRGLPTVCFIDPESREEGERVTETVSDVDDACARVERLMSDDIAWQRSSERCLRHFKRVHSVEAMLAAYEPILASLGGRLR